MSPPNPPGTVWERVRTALERWNAILQRRDDPAARAEKLAARAKLLRQQRTGDVVTEETRLFLAFAHGSQRFAAAIEEVIEVQALDAYSTVPGTPPFIRGVVNWRGSVLTLLDLTSLFGIPQSGLTDAHVCVIAEAGGRRIALMASEVEEILAIPVASIKRMPELPGQAPADWVMGLHEERRVLLRLEKVLSDPKLTQTRE